MLELNCPCCAAMVLWNEDFPYRPFCSLRCKQKDFGDWASERHVLPGDSEIDEYFSESDIGTTQS